VTILAYHSVDPSWRSPLSLTPEAFERHCRWLARRRDVTDLAAAVDRVDRAGRLPGRTVALTFDDGFAALFGHALPALLAHGLPATVFLVAETLAAGGGVHASEGPSATLAVDQVLEMQEAGVRFGSHGFRHVDLTRFSEEECRRDLEESREILEGVLGRSVPFLAYPGGHHTERVRRAARRAGFTHAFAMVRDRQPVTIHSLPRVGVYRGDGPMALAAKTARWYLPLRRSAAYPAVRAAVRGRTPQR
jgi:peptidoglycan/xylan/chitin deacetylase (PgdA/CDA1 family)